MSIVRVSKRERYVVIDKTGLEDSRISFKATGILAFLLAKPDDWTISYRGLMQVKKEKQHAVLAGLKELETHGYLRREKRKSRHGVWEWEQVLYERPHALVIHARKTKAWETHASTEERTTEEGLTEKASSTPPYSPPPADEGEAGSKRFDLEKELSHLADSKSVGDE